MTHPLPEAFVKKMKSLLGNEYDEFIQSYQNSPSKGIRINTLKVSAHQFPKMVNYDLEPIPWAAEGFYYQEEARPGKHPYHAAGLYYIQEPSAMAVVEALDPQPGETVLDIAAAPGGKATQAAIRMKNTGLLIANEIHPARAKILSENVKRLGITNTVVLNEEPEHLKEHFGAFFDRIIVDAPCSGEGMFRKDAEARLEWSAKQVAACAMRQNHLLDIAAMMLKPGGKLVYSTCTFSPEENEEVIVQFLERHPEWRIIPVARHAGYDKGMPNWASPREESIADTVRLWPHHLKGEGHYIALLQKSGEPKDPLRQHAKVKSKASTLIEARRLFITFMETYLNLSWQDFDSGEMILFGAHLYLLPQKNLSWQKLKVLRAGLHLGEIKKNRFEPSHALAMALRADDFKQTVNYPADGQEIASFLRGESLSASPQLKGWTGVLVDGFPLGWGKASDGVLKNHYPKGLRIL